MKKEVSARDKKIVALIFRWRWVMTFGAVLNVWAVVDHYKRHDVIGWPMPSAWVLPWLTFGGVGLCVLAVMIWIAYLYKPRRDG